jgi:hypothetical protein
LGVPWQRGQRALICQAMMRRESVTINFIRAGDVLDLGDLGPWWAIVKDVVEDKDTGNLHLHAVKEDGAPNEQVWVAGTHAYPLVRVGKDCTPTLDGLRDFIARYRPSRRA